MKRSLKQEGFHLFWFWTSGSYLGSWDELRCLVLSRTEAPLNSRHSKWSEGAVHVSLRTLFPSELHLPRLRLPLSVSSVLPVPIQNFAITVWVTLEYRVTQLRMHYKHPFSLLLYSNFIEKSIINFETFLWKELLNIIF